MATNNEKKRFGRRAKFWVGTVILITVAFYFCMFKFADPQIGLKWWLAYAAIISVGSALVSGLLTITDVKGLIKLRK